MSSPVRRRAVPLCLVALILGAHAVPAQPDGFRPVTVWSPQVTNYEFFGRAVASLGTRLVVGAPGWRLPQYTTLPGRVYVMHLDGTVDRVLDNPTPAPNDEFGAAVAVAGTGIVVGAPTDDTVAVDAGAAYVFDAATGALVHTLLVPGSGTNSQCGRAVGALGTDPLVVCDGVYRFDGATGALVHHYTAPGCPGGFAVATAGGDVLSGGFGGTLCRFDGATGAVVQTYVDPEPVLGGAFGSSLGVDGNLLVVGGAGFSGTRESMYAFDLATGALLQAIRGPVFGTIYNAGFGTSVAAAGGVLVSSGWNSANFHDAATFAPLGLWRPEDLGRDRSRDTVTRVFDTSFAIWTDTVAPNVARGSVTVLDRCGNGVHSPGEQCDDGNATAGDGCSTACRLERCPTLTWPPALACQSLDARGVSTVLLKSRRRGPWAVNGDRFRWKWKGSGTLADFGDPTAATSYHLCFYDDLFATPGLQVDLALPGGGTCDGAPCWSPTGTTGWQYDDPDGTPSGVEKAVVQVRNGRATIAVSGSGARLDLPEPIGTERAFPFGFGWAVVLVESNSGACWSAGSGSAVSRRATFKGTARGS